MKDYIDDYKFLSKDVLSLGNAQSVEHGYAQVHPRSSIVAVMYDSENVRSSTMNVVSTKIGSAIALTKYSVDGAVACRNPGCASHPHAGRRCTASATSS